MKGVALRVPGVAPLPVTSRPRPTRRSRGGGAVGGAGCRRPARWRRIRARAPHTTRSGCGPVGRTLVVRPVLVPSAVAGRGGRCCSGVVVAPRGRPAAVARRPRVRGGYELGAHVPPRAGESDAVAMEVDRVGLRHAHRPCLGRRAGAVPRNVRAEPATSRRPPPSSSAGVRPAAVGLRKDRAARRRPPPRADARGRGRRLHRRAGGPAGGRRRAGGAGGGALRGARSRPRLADEPRRRLWRDRAGGGRMCRRRRVRRPR